MSLYTSSFNRQKKMVLLFFTCLFLMLAPFEYFARNQKWEGGFVRLLDNKGTVQEDYNLAEARDLLIVGSSRVKEAVRPSGFEPFFGESAKVYNGGCHSCVSPEVVHQLIGNTKTLPKNVIITVEPMHFSSKYNHFDRLEKQKIQEHNAQTAEAIAVTTKKAHSIQHAITRLASFLLEINNNALNKINTAVSAMLYTTVQAASPSQRCFLHLWSYGLFYGVTKSVTPVFNPKRFLSELYLYTLGKGARWHSVVVHYERGYEGHILKMPDPYATREMAFESHMRNYVESVLPNYQDALVSPFVQDIQTLIDKGVNVILVRLPIYQKLYEIEETMTPQFNAQMAALAKKVNVRYLNMNTLTPEITENPLCFTDASHMAHDKTQSFTEALLKAVRPWLIKP